MKIYSLFAALCGVVVISACVGTYQDPNEYHAVPSKNMSLVTEIPIEKLQEGHKIYKAQCSKCHEPKLPGAIPSGTWHKVIPGMAWNAGLTKSEEEKLNTYIIAASRFIEMEYEH